MDNLQDQEMKALIDAGDVVEIAEAFNKLIGKVDSRRLEFSNLALTLYATITSGLVVLATSLTFHSTYEKMSYLVIVITSVLIVFSCMLERFGYFLSSQTIADRYFAHVRETGKPLNKPIGGKEWHSRLIKIQVYAIFTLFIINLSAVLLFVAERIFR